MDRPRYGEPTDDRARRRRRDKPDAVQAEPYRGTGIDEIGDELSFAYKSAANRCIERAKHQSLLPSDKLFAIFALYFADRNERFVQRVLASPLRLEYVSPIELVSSPQMTREEVRDLRSVLAQLVRAAVASAGDEAALSTSSMHAAFWSKCSLLLDAVEHARDAAEEPKDDIDATAVRAAKEEIEDTTLEVLSRCENLALAVAEIKAVARSGMDGVDAGFFATAAIMAEMIHAKRMLSEFEEQFFVEAEVPPPPAASKGDPNSAMSEAECAVLMEESGEQLEPEQQLFMDEIVSYGQQHPPSWSTIPRFKALLTSNMVLKKPDRFAKVMAGFRWNKYTKAHYDPYLNPPPKTVTAYEFTLMYPDLLEPRIPSFEVLPTEKGWEDEYCIIVFKAGPPYLDVGYRIANKQWDKRQGGVRASFEPGGRFKLYFRFTSTSYRR